MNQLGDAILVMIFLHWFGFPWSLGFVVVMAALGFPVWVLRLRVRGEPRDRRERP